VLIEKSISFDGYVFPKLEGLIYEKDGDKEGGEVLFIDDTKGRFTITFEVGMQCLDLLLSASRRDDFQTMEYVHNNKRLHLCYPQQAKKTRPSMGYFHLEITDENGDVHILPGQMSIVPDVDYSAGLLEFVILHKLFYGIRLAG